MLDTYTKYTIIKLYDNRRQCTFKRNNTKKRTILYTTNIMQVKQMTIATNKPSKHLKKPKAKKKKKNDKI